MVTPLLVCFKRSSLLLAVWGATLAQWSNIHLISSKSRVRIQPPPQQLLLTKHISLVKNSWTCLVTRNQSKTLHGGGYTQIVSQSDLQLGEMKHTSLLSQFLPDIHLFRHRHGWPTWGWEATQTLYIVDKMSQNQSYNWGKWYTLAYSVSFYLTLINSGITMVDPLEE